MSNPNAYRRNFKIPIFTKSQKKRGDKVDGKQDEGREDIWKCDHYKTKGE
jgi:hypothetical protein